MGGFGGPIGSIIGAIIGNALLPGIGGPIGAVVGGELGSLADPKHQQPTIPDIRISGSAYGQYIRRAFGTMRLPGNMIDRQPDGVQTQSDGGGKKDDGGSSSASLTFQMAFCEGEILFFRRVWFDSALVYSVVPGEEVGDDLPMTFYTGTATQMPDPTFVAIRGDVPAYRHTAYISFDNLDITKYGRVPNIEAEVVTHGGTIPWRVSEFGVPQGTSLPFVAQATYVNQVLTVAYIEAATPKIYHERHYTILGDATGTDVDENVPVLPGGGAPVVQGRLQNSNIWFGFNSSNNAWYMADTPVTAPVNNPLGGNDSTVANGLGYLQDGAVYVITSNTINGHVGISKFDAPSGVPIGISTVFYDFGADTTSLYRVSGDEDGSIYVCKNNTPLASDLWKFDETLTLIHHWTSSDTPITFVKQNFAIWNGYLCFNISTGGFGNFYVYKINADFTFTFVGLLPQVEGNIVSLGNGLILGADGVVSLNPPALDITVGQIIAALNPLGALDATDYDVTEMTDIIPGGFEVDRMMSIRDAETQLLVYAKAAAVESNFRINYKKLDHDPVVTLQDDDYAVHADGSEIPPDFTDEMMHEEESPQAVNLTYMNIGADQQPNTQVAQRQGVNSVLQSSVQLAIAMDDAKALELANVLLYSAWQGRHKVKFQGDRRFLVYDPLDNIIGRDGTYRIDSKTDGIDGVCSMALSSTLIQLFTQGGNPGPASGFVPRRPVIPPTGASGVAVLLDIPLLSDDDINLSFYVASPFAGVLFKSSDGGANYVTVGNLSVAPAIGAVAVALPDFTGGNVPDEIHIMRVVLTSGSLSSTTDDGLLDGVNEGVVGLEVIQWRTATLVAANTYDLSGLLRGRRGTEWTIATHAANEVFAIPGNNFAITSSELGKVRLYKAVRSGSTISATTPVSFICNGASAEPYMPVLLGGGVDGSGNVTVSGERRTRIGGTWPNLGDVPLGETAEAYMFQFWDSAYANVARRAFTTVPECEYPGADQTTDFGDTQAHVYFTMAQVGSYGIGKQAKGVAGGAGLTDDSVIAPIAPYGSSPGSAGCTLPTVTAAFNWATPVNLLSGVITAAQEWVISFTTGTAVPGAFYVEIGEYATPLTVKQGVLAAGPCDSPFTPACAQTGGLLRLRFFMQDNPHPTVDPTLAPSTTYYVSVNPSASCSMYATLVKP